MEKQKKYELDMCNGSIAKSMLLFAVPLMCSGILQLLFNAADIIVVGRFAGDTALAAVGANTSLIALLTNLFIGLSVGGNVLAARFCGAGKGKDVSETVHTAILLSAYCGIFLTIVGVAAAKPILELMQAPEDVLGQAVVYLRIYCLGMTSMMLYNFGSAILRAVGDTRRPLYYLTLAGVINVVLNLILVIRFNLGVAGVAIATSVSQTVSAILVLRSMMQDTGDIRLELKKLRIHKDKLKRILQVGVPAGLQGTLFSLSNVVIQSSINSFGAIVIAGNSAAHNIGTMEYAAMNAFHQAAMSFVSQNYGAGQYKRINKIVVTAMVYVIIIGALLGNAATLFGEVLLGIYSSSEEVIAAGLVRMHIMDVTHFVAGAMEVMVGALRGLGYSVMPMIVSLIGACGLRLVWIWTIFQIPRFHTLKMLYVSYPVTWVITLSAHLLCYFVVKRKIDKRVGI